MNKESADACQSECAAEGRDGAPKQTARPAAADESAAACQSECAAGGPYGALKKEVRGGPAAYWRSLDELADTPEFREFVHREFAAGAIDRLDSSERRQFLKLMGASMALAGLGLQGCRRWPEETIVPYAHRPPGRAPGVAVRYATSMEVGGVGAGLLVTSYDGRPTKIEGNPEHPISRGATDAAQQASVLELYDPDRSRSVFKGSDQSTWAAFDEWAGSHFGALEARRGEGLHVLGEATSSPSLLELKRRFLRRFPRARWHEYEPIHNDNERAGARMAFGSPYRSHYAFDRAKFIVSLDSDFLGAHPAAVKHARDFARSRRANDPDKSMSRLYVFESGYSLTGANADHRVAVRSADVAVIAGRLAAALLDPKPFADFLAAIGDLHEGQPVLAEAINDLRNHPGESLLVAGPRQPAEVHYLCHLLNEALGNVGSTVRYSDEPDDPDHLESITALGEDLAAGKVQTLVILGGNPVYNAPADLNFAAHLDSVKSIHLSLYRNETSQRCTWHLPRAHYLESWGDTRAYDGTFAIVQPLIQPLHGGRSAIELVAGLSGDELSAGYDIVRRTFEEFTRALDFERMWRRTLHDGVLAGSEATPATRRANPRHVKRHVESLGERWAGGDRDGFELTFVPDPALHDGRFANNGWLQELPDPLTKLTWDNAVILSPAAGGLLGVTTGDRVRVSVGNRAMEAAVLLMPGQHAASATLTLGYGRRFAGRVCSGAGFDFYQLRTAEGDGISGGATIKKINGTYELAITQDHHAIESVAGKGTQERLPSIFREATLAHYREHPDFAKHKAHVVHRLSLWDESHPFHSAHGLDEAAYAWGMSIDLNTCTGCSACVVACQAENNIPIVGKDQVKRGRELHWIRIDRYFKGTDPETPDALALQPVACMHCENAPCEQVCPVAATVHDKDGLNVMIYNRCIGTRYCSNNCPYKVRRFNFFDFHRRGPLREQPGRLLQVEPDYYLKEQAGADPLQRMQFNPEVTVRVRGVMEKCTYCIQRISAAKIEAKNEWVRTPPEQRPRRVTVPDGSLVPACAQACPAEAIVFGDLNDPRSRVAAMHKEPRAYELLEELNTKPRTRYLAKLRNPAPALAAEGGARPSPSGTDHG